MACKPISELAGGQSPRQRVWAYIRRQPGEFSWKDVTPGGVPKKTSTDYLKSLVAAGYLIVGSDESRPYSLARDNGIEAPRVRKDGSEVTQGSGNEAIWGAVTVLDTFNVETIADLSGAAYSTVKTYCRFLERAGYLTIVIQGKGGCAATTYRTVKSRISGPRAPMITRLKVVYDPNLHQIVWGEGADEAVKEMDHA